MPLTMEQTALAYAAIGVPVLPMHGIANKKCSCGACERPGKHPRIKGGVHSATTDKEQIKQWWLKWPDANIGLATGSKIVVLDIDPRNGGLESLKQLEIDLGPLPGTVKVKTGGGGYHYYFAPPAFPLKSDTSGKLLLPGVDVLGHGSIAIAPTSRHVSGHLYKFIKGRNLLKGAPLKALPELWCERLKPGAKSAPEVQSVSPSNVGPILQGRRNARLTQIGGYLVSTKLKPEAVLQCLLVTNQHRCVPQLDEAEVKKIADSVERYRAPQSRTLPQAPAYDAFAMALAEHYAGGRHLRFIPRHGFHVYDGTKWVIEEDEFISNQLLLTIETQPVSSQGPLTLLPSVLKLAKIKQVAREDLFYSDARHCVLNLANGELWIGGDGAVTFKEHSPESNLMHCLQVHYDPDAKCPMYDRAVRDIFQHAELSKDMARHWNEVAGYIIQTIRDIPLILMLLGKGANGKTALWMTLRQLIGDKNIFSGSVGQLVSDRFMMGYLRGKILLVDDDIQAGQKLPDGPLKKISEDKLLTGQLKNQNAFQFTNRAVPLLLCNNPPTVGDLSKGLRRRIMVIPFEHEFQIGKDLDPKLWKRIRRKEMSGILNRLIRGLQRLRKRGHFKMPSDVQRAKRDWLRDANPLVRFLADRTKAATGKQRILVSDLYREYEQWTAANGIQFKLQRNNLAKQLEHLGYNVKPSNKGKVVIGLRLRERQS